MESFVEVSAQYLPGSNGTKIVYTTTADNGLEVYDAAENRKWRFAPARGKNNGWISDIMILEWKGLIASPYEEAIRFWKVPFGGRT